MGWKRLDLVFKSEVLCVRACFCLFTYFFCYDGEDDKGFLVCIMDVCSLFGDGCMLMQAIVVNFAGIAKNSKVQPL